MTTAANLNARTAAFAALTTDQIKAAFIAARMPGALTAHGNVYNQIRAGLINEAIGTIKAGASSRTHKDARKALREALRVYIPGL